MVVVELEVIRACALDPEVLDHDRLPSGSSAWVDDLSVWVDDRSAEADDLSVWADDRPAKADDLSVWADDLSVWADDRSAEADDRSAEADDRSAEADDLSVWVGFLVKFLVETAISHSVEAVDHYEVEVYPLALEIFRPG
jgi:hypothetical protein